MPRETSKRRGSPPSSAWTDAIVPHHKIKLPDGEPYEGLLSQLPGTILRDHGTKVKKRVEHFCVAGQQCSRHRKVISSPGNGTVAAQ